MPTDQRIRLFFGTCIPVEDLAEVLSLDHISASSCPFCEQIIRPKSKFCSNCGTKLNGTISEATDMDVFQVLINILGKTPPQITTLLYNGYVCIGYELAQSSKGVAIFDNMPHYKPWKEMMELVQKYVNKDPLASKSHLIKASFFALGG